jgi:hypothetical protein
MASLYYKLKNLITPSPKENVFSPTVELAVDKIMSGLPIGERTKIANMDERKLVEFHLTYGIFIKNEFRLWNNAPLKKSCCEVSGLQTVNPDQASYIILKELQKKIKETDVLKVAK